MNILDYFNAEIEIPNIKEVPFVDHVLKDLELFNDDERNQAKGKLEILQKKGNFNLNIGIKRLLMVIEMSRQDSDNKVDKFVTTIEDLNTTVDALNNLSLEVE